jgi:hypothetical protein
MVVLAALSIIFLYPFVGCLIKLMLINLFSINNLLLIRKQRLQ